MIAINGGGGSSCLMYSIMGDTGPIKTILTGNIIPDMAFFQATSESLPVLRIESGGLGNPLGPVVPKSEVVIKRKANPEIMKRITNFFLEMLIILNYITLLFATPTMPAITRTSPSSCPPGLSSYSPYTTIKIPNNIARVE